MTYYVTLPYKMLAHEAWLTLKPKAKVILIDFKRHLDRMTIFGKYPIPKGGIPFSHGHCIDIVHRNTFYRTMNDIEDRGFLRGTDQTDIDGQSTYYVPSAAWMNYVAPDADRKKVDRLKQRILAREARDKRISCTISVHPPTQFVDNPLLKFWSDPTALLHKKSAPLHYDQIGNLEDRAHARVKQEEFQHEPFQGPYDPAHGEEERAAMLEAIRRRNAQQAANDAPPTNIHRLGDLLP